MTGPPSPKRQRTGEKEEAEAPVIDEKVQKVLESVAAVEEEIDAEEQKMNKEIIKIEAKYNTAKRPFYEKRGKLLRDIPGFWKQAFNNHPVIATAFDDGEEQVLEALEDVDVTFIDDAGGFKVELTFGDNEFFPKGKIWKEIKYNEEGEFEVKASGVKWKDSKEPKEESIFLQWLASTEGDQDIAESIKDELWKNPVALFAADESDDEEEGEEDDEDEEDDDVKDEE